MKYILLILNIFVTPHISLTQNHNEGVQRGWLAYFGTEEICFPENINKSHLNFFNKVERLNGYNVNYTAYKSCVYKQISKEYPISIYYGNDSIFVLPVTFEFELNDDKKSSKKNGQDGFTLYEIKYKGEKYKLGYISNSDVKIKNIRPYLKRDLKKERKTECPFYQGQ